MRAVHRPEPASAIRSTGRFALALDPARACQRRAHPVRDRAGQRRRWRCTGRTGALVTGLILRPAADRAQRALTICRLRQGPKRLRSDMGTRWARQESPLRLPRDRGDIRSRARRASLSPEQDGDQPCGARNLNGSAGLNSLETSPPRIRLPVRSSRRDGAPADRLSLSRSTQKTDGVWTLSKK